MMNLVSFIYCSHSNFWKCRPVSMHSINLSSIWMKSSLKFDVPSYHRIFLSSSFSFSCFSVQTIYFFLIQVFVGFQVLTHYDRKKFFIFISLWQTFLVVVFLKVGFQIIIWNVKILRRSVKTSKSKNYGFWNKTHSPCCVASPWITY